jgi:uncharacterized protein DUF4157
MLAQPVAKAATTPKGRALLQWARTQSNDRLGERPARETEQTDARGVALGPSWDFSTVPLSSCDLAVLSHKCAVCEEEEMTAALQTKPGGSSRGVADHMAPRIVHEVLGEQGQPLDRAVRASVEPIFRTDFSAVRVHTDPKAAESARRVGALAYTVGTDIVFATGRYAPDTNAGRRLLAHELTHVVQQRRGPAKSRLLQSAIPINDPADGFERQADAVADGVARLTGGSGQAAGAAIQRQSEQAPDETETPTEAQDDHPPSGSIGITEELFEEDPGNPGQLQTAPDPTAGFMLQRSNGIPPPPPAYPSSYQWFNDVSGGDVDFGSLFGLTCKDGRERGFHIMWNERTNKSYPGPVAMGEPAKGCTSAGIQLGPVPPDRKPTYPVGWFHTHPLANPGCHKVDVGPSDTDKKTSSTTGLPGLVVDTKTPTSSCRDAGYFFFGPTTRT